MQSYISVSSDFGTKPLIVFTNGSAEFCVIEHLNLNGSVEHASDRTLALRHLDIKGYRNTPTGTGKAFLEDIIGKPILVLYPQQLWARQIDTESASGDPLPAFVENHGGSVWIMGMKTESKTTHPAAIWNFAGNTELLGAHFYPLSVVSTNNPLFIIEGGRVSLSYLVSGDTSPLFPTQVRETRAGITRILTRAYVPTRGNGVNVPLYIGYEDALRIASPRPEPAQFGFEINGLPGYDYALEVTTNLQNWSPLLTNRMSFAPWTYGDTNTAGATNRFYRARQIEP